MGSSDGGHDADGAGGVGAVPLGDVLAPGGFGDDLAGDGVEVLGLHEAGGEEGVGAQVEEVRGVFWGGEEDGGGGGGGEGAVGGEGEEGGDGGHCLFEAGGEEGGDGGGGRGGAGEGQLLGVEGGVEGEEGGGDGGGGGEGGGPEVGEFEGVGG